MLKKQITKLMGGTSYNVAECTHADTHNVYCGLKLVTGLDKEGNESVEKHEPHNWFPIGDPDINLNTGEVEYLHGEQPRVEWLKSLTQQWLTEQGIEWTVAMTEGELLELIP
ncbi:MAG: hypothetical protein QM504_10945 [Pseudomonadota bacterium]